MDKQSEYSSGINVFFRFIFSAALLFFYFILFADDTKRMNVLEIATAIHIKPIFILRCISFCFSVYYI